MRHRARRAHAPGPAAGPEREPDRRGEHHGAGGRRAPDAAARAAASGRSASGPLPADPDHRAGPGRLRRCHRDRPRRAGRHPGGVAERAGSPDHASRGARGRSDLGGPRSRAAEGPRRNCFREVASCGRRDAAPHVLGPSLAPRQRWHLPDGGGRPVVRLDADRADRRAPRVPLLRRAFVEGPVAAHPAHQDGAARVRQHSGRIARGRGGRLHHRAIRPDAAAAQLSHGLRGRPLGAHRRREGGRRRHRGRSDRAATTRSTSRVGEGDHAPDPAAAGGVVRHRVPVREARRDRRPARARRDGERRAGHLRVDAPAGPSRRGHPRLPPRPGERLHPRARPHVVRRPGHQRLVGRSVAERGVRHLDDLQDAGVVAPGMGSGPGSGRSARARAGGG